MNKKRNRRELGLRASRPRRQTEPEERRDDRGIEVHDETLLCNWMVAKH